MARKTVNVRVELDTPLDLEIERWAKEEGRSKRRQAAVLLRKLAGLKETDPDALAKLGLVDRSLCTA